MRIMVYEVRGDEQAEKLEIRVCSASYAPNGVADIAVMLTLMCLRH